jgi:hypothetical protein
MRMRFVLRFALAIALASGFVVTPGHAQTTTHGMTIPAGHPRIWYNPARLAAARAWFNANPFTASGRAGHDFQREQATQCLLGQNATVCNAAVAWAMSVTLPTTGVACDECRWEGEAAILTFDWAYNFFTPAQRTTFINNWNNWLAAWRDAAWGGNRFHAYNGMPKYGNNYYWGYLRNEALWGIATAGENPQANAFLTDALTTRWTEEFVPAATTLSPQHNSHVGGVLPEGDQYGIYMAAYAGIPFLTGSLHGRNLFGETNFHTEAVFNIIYSTTLAPTTHGQNEAGYEVFPFNDSQYWRNGDSATLPHYIDFMGTMISAMPQTGMARWAQRWLNLDTSSVRSPHIQSTLPAVSPLAFTSLPLDYYMPGIGFFYGKNSWNPNATAFLWMMGQHGVIPGVDATTVGHRHDEIGSFQIWRNGRWLTRNDSSYSDGNVAGGDPAGLLGANTIMINGNNIRYNEGQWTVRRAETRPQYAYANTDFTSVYGGIASTVQREYVFVRSLETTVIFDRINTPGSTTKTWLAHFETNPTLQDANHVNAVNGSEALRVTTLVPANPVRRVVAEGGAVGQYRLEIDTTGTQSYFLTALQAKSASGEALNPTVVDTGGSYQVTLNGTVTITFDKGASSSGGSITISGATTPFRSDVQPISVTAAAGPSWQGAQAVTVPAAPLNLSVN